MSYTLHAPEASFRAFATLIAAEYNEVTVDVNTDLSAASKSPIGKLPLLETPSGETIFSAHSMARYIASLRRDTGLTGNSFQDTATIDSWMDWAAQEVELPACVWFYPVAKYMPFHQNAYEKAKKDFGKALAVLNQHLEKSTFLVNDHVTLADIVMVSTLLYPFKLVADKEYLGPYEHVVRWFQACINQPEFERVLGKVQLCEKETKVKSTS